MQGKTFGVLAVAAAALGLAVYVAAPDTKMDAGTPAATALFPDLSTMVNDVTSLEIATTGGRFRIERGAEGRWTVPEKSGYPASFALVKRAILGLAELKVVEAKTNRSDRHGKLDLTGLDQQDSKAVKVSLQGADGRDLGSLLIGKTKSAATTSRPGRLYVRKPDDDQTWLVDTWLDAKPKAKDWLEPELFKLSKDRVKEVVTIHADSELVQVIRDRPEDKPRLVGLTEAEQLKSAFTLEGMMSSLESLRFEDVRPRDELDFTAAARTEIRTFDSLVVHVELVALGGDGHWVTFRAEGKDTDQALADQINATTAGWAYRMAEYQAKYFMQRRSDLVEPRETEPNQSSPATNQQ